MDHHIWLLSYFLRQGFSLGPEVCELGWLIREPQRATCFAPFIPWLQVQVSPWSASVPGLSPCACLHGRHFILLRELSPPDCLFLFLFPPPTYIHVSHLFVSTIFWSSFFCVHPLYFLIVFFVFKHMFGHASFFLGYLMIEPSFLSWVSCSLSWAWSVLIP